MTRPAALLLAAALVSAATLASGCAKKSDDVALAQGEWVIAAIDTPEEGNGMRFDELKTVSVVVQGNRVSVSHPTEKGVVSATFKLDPTKEPRTIDLTDVTVTGDGPEQSMPGTTRGIYKFEGDELVFAVPLGAAKDLPRPTEFKPSTDRPNDRGVFVFRLKKK